MSDQNLKEGETAVEGLITRVVDMGDGVDPMVFFRPTSDVRELELEGHRIATGELLVAHDKLRVPKQFDPKRVDTPDGLKVGAKIGLVHLGKVVR